MKVGGFLPPMLAGRVAQQKEDDKNFHRAAMGAFCPDEEDDDDSLARALAAAVEEYKDKVLRGLNALTDEDIQDKLDDFVAFFAPEEPATEQELADFALKFAEFARMLEEFRANQGNKESLITVSGNQQDEEYLGYMRSQLPSNPLLQQQLQSDGGF